jgi:hypothetical protein
MCVEEEHAMTHKIETEAEIEKWKALHDDRVAMLGLTGVDEGHAQPMSGQILHDED